MFAAGFLDSTGPFPAHSKELLPRGESFPGMTWRQHPAMGQPACLSFLLSLSRPPGLFPRASIPRGHMAPGPLADKSCTVVVRQAAGQPRSRRIASSPFQGSRTSSPRWSTCLIEYQARRATNFMLPSPDKIRGTAVYVHCRGLQDPDTGAQMDSHCSLPPSYVHLMASACNNSAGEAAVIPAAHP